MKSPHISVLLALCLVACSGSDGADGRDGTAGADGTAGSDGTDGKDGVSTLTLTDDEPAGDNCPYGGVRFTTGKDEDGDGDLSESEQADEHFACNGAPGISSGDEDGGLVLPVVFTTPASETDCPDGGVVMAAGYDLNDDGDLLDPNEAFGDPAVVCGGAVAGYVDAEALNGARPIVTESEPPTGPGVFANQVDVATPVFVDGMGDPRGVSIVAPRPGVVLVFASAVAYCSPFGSGTDAECAEAPASSGVNLIIEDTATPPGTVSAGAGFTWLAEDVAATVTASQVFPVEAGTHAFYLYALEATEGTNTSGSKAKVWLHNPRMILVFMPNG